ncbi:MAG: DUF3298 domain-containing protein [Muribaculaceae bacterium]|nr:DUF3298 domain-containing protein [Muribaculaceae bacterium]
MMTFSRLVISVFVPLMVLTTTLLSCQGTTTTGAETQQGKVKLDSCRLSDTTSFVKSNGERCAIYADANIIYPLSLADKASTEQLQRLFAAFVLNAPDSLSLTDALRATVSNTLHQYDFVEQTVDDQTTEDDGAQVVYNYNTTTTVTVNYNQHDIITFCKTEMVRKNDHVTSVTHRYYSFDLQNMAYIDLHKMFRDEAMADVTALLRARLLEQNKATSDDKLNDMGYFNVDNLSVTRNFYFDQDGVTWSYLPSQLAVDAVGEPQITLTYDQLAPLACDGSVINRLH